jgi:hypothetical protein
MSAAWSLRNLNGHNHNKEDGDEGGCNWGLMACSEDDDEHDDLRREGDGEEGFGEEAKVFRLPSVAACF